MRRKGPWSAQQIDSFLRDTAIPLRLACQTSSGWPVVLSLWYLHREDALWCASASSSRVVQLLARVDREVAIRIEPHRLMSWDYTERMTVG